VSEAGVSFPVPNIPSAVDFDVIDSEIVRNGLNYWLAKRGTHAMPARADLDPLIDVPSLCPSMMLKDVQRGPLDFRYRLIGTRLRHHMTADWKGQLMSEIEFQKAPNPIWNVHAYVAETGLPIFLRPPYVGPHKDFLHIDAVVLPLGKDHKEADMLMIFIEFLSTSAKRPPA
jgi:hypothetical protein